MSSSSVSTWPPRTGSYGIDCVADKSGIITTAHGLRIACLGGVYDQSIHFTAETAPVCLLNP